MNILVTGGAGFMGSNFVRFLLTHHPEDSVVVFDKLTYAGNQENLRDLESNHHFSFVSGDICDGPALAEVVQKFSIDAIVNYAAETHVDRSITDPEQFLRTDIFGMFHLLETVKKFPIKTFVQISTDEVFGSIAEGAFTETSAFAPNSPYSAAKAGGDLLARAYHTTYGTPVIVTHSCNVYGPYQYPEKVIPLFVTNLMEGKKVPLYGDGQNVREWIHVSDHCRAIDMVLRKAQAGSVYNIGTGEEIKNVDLTRMILKEFGKGDEMIERVPDRLGHDRRYAIDATNIQKDLGWKPTISFAEGLKETVEWYQKNESWWKKLKTV